MDQLVGENRFTRNLPGAQGATLAQINEIVRGATIKCIREDTALTPTGGEAVCLELNNGDKLFFLAEATSPPLILNPEDPRTAHIQPLLQARRGSRLKF